MLAYLTNFVNEIKTSSLLKLDSKFQNDENLLILLDLFLETNYLSQLAQTLDAYFFSSLFLYFFIFSNFYFFIFYFFIFFLKRDAILSSTHITEWFFPFIIDWFGNLKIKMLQWVKKIVLSDKVSSYFLIFSFFFFLFLKKIIHSLSQQHQ